jgi:hypothetical protein
VVIPPAARSQPQFFAVHITIRLTNGGRILLPITAGVDLVCQVVDTVARASVPREDRS